MIDPPFRSPRARVGGLYSRKFGWNDRVAEFLLKVKAEDGTAAEAADLLTAFELMDYREGRTQRGIEG